MVYRGRLRVFLKITKKMQNGGTFQRPVGYIQECLCGAWLANMGVVWPNSRGLVCMWLVTH